MKLIALFCIAALPSLAVADWTADPSDRFQAKAGAAVESFRSFGSASVSAAPMEKA